MAESKGAWIAFEGNDGAGKTYQLERFAGHLLVKGFPVVITREPGGNPFSEDLRKSIFDTEIKNDPITQLLLFTAARRRNIQNVVIPAIRDGKIVLGDRSEGSTYAYQWAQYNLPFKTVKFINDFATEGIRPDLTIFLKVNPKVGLQRVQNTRGSLSYFEEVEDHEWIKRDEGYRELLKIFNGWILIDANQKEDVVFEDIVNAVKRIEVIKGL